MEREEEENEQRRDMCMLIFIYCSVIPFCLQSVPVHSANCVNTYTVECRRVLSSATL
jgi:hypothetical protein